MIAWDDAQGEPMAVSLLSTLLALVRDLLA